MIEQALASELLTPLWQLFPRSDDVPDYQDLIIRTLAKASADEVHAAATVERLIDTCRFKPLPVEVLDAASQVAVAAEPEQWPDDWQPGRRPDDEPFGGLADLIDDRLRELLRVKAERGRTHAERESAKQFLRMRETHEQRELAVAGGAR